MTGPAGTIPPVLLVGFGRMGTAMAAGWRERGLAASFAIDPTLPASPGPEVTMLADSAALPDGFAPSAVILAVKPHMAASAVPSYRRFSGGAVFVSIMAGRTVSGLRDMLGEGAAIVRAMPNTPAAIRQGITVAFPSPGVDAGQRALCDTLLRAVGEVAWIDDETLLDPVTAVSGSGPAYVFLLAELLERAAVEQGIAPALAARLARQTVAGSGALLAASSADAAALRRGVTSPHGTTERALAVLMDRAAWPAAVSGAVAAATRRSRELAG